MKQTILLLSILISISVFAQLARFTYGQGGFNFIQQVKEAPDGNLLTIGSADEKEPNRGIWLQKIRTDGSLIWGKIFKLPSGTETQSGYNLEIEDSGNLLITGFSENTDTEREGLFMKTDAEGNLIFQKTYSNVSAIFDVMPTGDGYLLSGSFFKTSEVQIGVILKTDLDGNLKKQQEIPVGRRNPLKKIMELSDGNFMIFGRGKRMRLNSSGAGALSDGLVFIKITKEGDIISQKEFHAYHGRKELFEDDEPDAFHQPLGVVLHPEGGFWVSDSRNIGIFLYRFSEEGELISQVDFLNFKNAEHPFDLTLLQDEGLLIAGFFGFDPVQGFAIRTDRNGKTIWRKNYNVPDGEFALLSALQTSSGQIWLGGSAVHGSGQSSVLKGELLRLDSTGNVLPYRIDGRVILDLNGNCVADLGEPPAKNIFIKTNRDFQKSILTDETGRFTFYTEEGITRLTPHLPDSENTDLCNDPLVYFDKNSSSTQELIFLIKEKEPNCAVPSVSLTEPELVRCSTSTFSATVNNFGGRETSEILIDLELAPALTLTDCSEIYTQNGNSLQISLKSLPPQASKNIRFEVETDCAASYGLTLPITAKLQSSDCLPDYSGANFKLESFCKNDKIQFEISNVGGGGSEVSGNYRVYVDDLLVEESVAIDLPESNAPHQLNFPRDGRTWRVEMNQFKGAPGVKRLVEIVEGCGVQETGFPTTGYYNFLPTDQTTAGVAKVFPRNEVANAPGIFRISGYKVRTVEPIEFTARFKNPLNEPLRETVFQFVFSANLDASTFLLKAATGQTQLHLTNDGVFTVSMENLHVKPNEEIAIRFSVKPLPLGEFTVSRFNPFEISGNVTLNDSTTLDLIPGLALYEKFDIKNASDELPYPEEFTVFDGIPFSRGRKIIPTDGGGFFIIGLAESSNHQYRSEGMVMKMNSKGETEWQTILKFDDFKSYLPLGLVAEEDGGCTIAGQFEGTTFLAKIDKNGNLNGRTQLTVPDPYFSKSLRGLLKTIDGGYFVFGETISTNYLFGNAFAAKFSEDGTLLWLKERAGTYPNLAVELPDGNFILAGERRNYGGRFIEKLDADGKRLWSQEIITEKYLETCIALKIHTDGRIVLEGSYKDFDSSVEQPHQPAFIEFLSDGTITNETYFANPKKPLEQLVDIEEIPGGGYLTVGYFRSDSMDFDFYVRQTDEDGNLIGEKFYEYPDNEYAYDLEISALGEFWAIGSTSSKMFLLRDSFPPSGLSGSSNFLNLKNDRREVLIAPNPAADEIRVLFSQPISKKIVWELIEPSGKKVKTGNAKGTDFTIDLSGLKNGIYFLTFPDKRFIPKRLIIIK